MEDNNPNPIDQEALQSILESEQLRRMIDDRASRIAGALSPNLILDMNNLSEDEARYMNRDVDMYREGAYHRTNKGVDNIEDFVPVNEAQPTKPEYRPYSVILDEAREAKDSNDETKLDEVHGELAARVLLTNPKETEDHKLDVLIDLQERGNLSEEDMSDIIEKMDTYTTRLTLMHNEIDEVIQERVIPGMEQNVSEGVEPVHFLIDSETGKFTDEYAKVDQQIGQVVKVNNLFIREAAKKDADEQINTAVTGQVLALQVKQMKEREESESAEKSEQSEGEDSESEELPEIVEQTPVESEENNNTEEDEEPEDSPENTEEGDDSEENEDTDEEDKVEQNDGITEELREKIDAKSVEFAKELIEVNNSSNGDGHMEAKSKALTAAKQKATKFRKGEVENESGLSYLRTAEGIADRQGYFMYLKEALPRPKNYDKMAERDQQAVDKQRDEEIASELKSFDTIANRAENGTKLGNALRSLRGRISKDKEQ